MKWMMSVVRTLFALAVFAVAAWLLGYIDPARLRITEHLLDWAMGLVCLVWLVVLLKAPWDLYFEAHRVGFELGRARERGIAVADGRDAYVRVVRGRLLALAVGAHVLSALLVVGVTVWTGATSVGYPFAVFYLVSTLFRPLVAGYAYLVHKLRAVGEETAFPRDDVVTVRETLSALEARLDALTQHCEADRHALDAEAAARQAEARDLRQRLDALGREFETTLSRLTDNQEVIKGIQAFVRVVARAGDNSHA
jgi:hypothetical protein